MNCEKTEEGLFDKSVAKQRFISMANLAFEASVTFQKEQSLWFNFR